MADTWIVEAADAGLRLDKFLAAEGRLGSRGRAYEALQRGKIFLNDAEATPKDARFKLKTGDGVRLWMDRPGSSRRTSQRPPRAGELPIVYEDEALVVVNKPAGLLSVPLPRREEAASVEDELVEYLRSKKRRPFVVHRIDRDTSGLVMFATRSDAQATLKDQFRRHEAERIYLALVYGVPSPAKGVWRDHLVWDQESLIQKETSSKDPHASEASCEYEVLDTYDGASLLEVALITGRRNQIRLQARLRGHTLVGEQRYVYGPQDMRHIEFERQALHAWRLGFVHPLSGKPMRFEAPLPPDMEALIETLQTNS